MLTFCKGNKKVGSKVYTFSLPAGYTCPGAKDCLAFAHERNGKAKLYDGKSAIFRCFSASQEVLFPSVRNSRWSNYNQLLKANGSQGMADLIQASLPKAKIIRIHVAGDFFHPDYFAAWVKIALANPKIIFYAYTKSLPFWDKYQVLIPANFRLTASLGGKYDYLAHDKRQAIVTGSEEEANQMDLEVDHDDTKAQAIGNQSFALVIHGNQKKGFKPQSLKIYGVKK